MLTDYEAIKRTLEYTIKDNEKFYPEKKYEYKIFRFGLPS
jgi:hypothetical protein